MILFKSSSLVLATAFLVRPSDSAPLTPLGMDNATIQPSVNFSAVDPLVGNSHFSVAIYPKHDRPVDSVSMLLSAVLALSAIGLRDMRRRGPAVHYPRSVRSSVVIEVKPKPPETTILNEVATLCIYYGIEEMTREKHFTEAVISCGWDDVEVAEVVIWKVDSVAVPEVVSVTTFGTSTEDLQNHFEPVFIYSPGGKTLDTITSFITIMEAIMRCSRYDSAATLPARSFYTDAGPKWDASVYFPSNLRPSRSDPPFLMVGHVIRALGLVPEFMLEHSRFAELEMIFTVDLEISLGSALLIKGKRQD